MIKGRPSLNAILFYMPVFKERKTAQHFPRTDRVLLFSE